MSLEPIYLDYAATAPVDPRVIDVMAECMGPRGAFANPSSSHAQGLAARRLVEQSRERIGARVNAQPEAIVFTSGATESNNLALRGVLGGTRGRLITARTEHKSVLDAARALAAQGVDVIFVGCDAGGLVDPAEVSAAIRGRPALVSIMHVNNETGVIQDIAEIARRCREQGALLHVDAAQSVGKVPLDVARWDVDLLSLTAHKAYGPKGIGALYLRPGLRIAPLLHGGAQERGLRPGTLAVHQILGMAQAYDLADPERDAAMLRALRERLRARLGVIEGVRFNGHQDRCAPHILNAAFPGAEGESLRLAIGEIAVSAGSACSSDDPEASHVLSSMGLSDARAASSLRFSVGRYTTGEEIDAAARRVAEAVARLRALAGCAPRWCSA
jgi:cysteine desulfurase